MAFGTYPYNNQYYGTGYPTYLPQQNIQQPIQQTINPIQQQLSETHIEVKFLTGDEAKAYIVMPNRKAIIIDNTNSLLYSKSADGLGQSYMDTYKLVKLDNSVPRETSNIDMEKFVNKDDLKAYITTDQLNETFKTFKTEIEKNIADIKKTVSLKKTLEENLKNG